MTTVPTTDVPTGRDLPVLDSLRAVGAVAVMTTHCAFNAGAYTSDGWFGVFLARMDFGVAIFFVLSGFLLSRAWLASAASGGPRPALGRYYLKRAARVLPAFWVVALVALLLVPGNDDRSAAGWVRALTLTDIYTDSALAHGLTQTWSLATELSFYALLPAMMWLLLGPRSRSPRPARIAIGLAAGLTLAVAWLATSHRMPFATSHANEWLPAYLGWFGAGIALAGLDAGPSTPAVRRVRAAAVSLARQPGVCWALALGVLLIASTPLAGPTALVPSSEAEAVTKNLLYLVAATLIVVTGVWTTPGRYRSALSHPAARRLGRISYSFFLVHVAVLALVMGVTGFELFQGRMLEIWLLTFALSWAASEVLYRWVEEPVQRLVRSRPAAARSTPSTASTR